VPAFAFPRIPDFFTDTLPVFFGGMLLCFVTRQPPQQVVVGLGSLTLERATRAVYVVVLRLPLRPVLAVEPLLGEVEKVAFVRQIKVFVELAAYSRARASPSRPS
jgi:hypothetical protein